jgi:hypothetical protein
LPRRADSKKLVVSGFCVRTKRAEIIQARRRRDEQRRRESIRSRIADGALASVSNDTKWQKVLSELAALVPSDTAVTVKRLDSEDPCVVPGLLDAGIERTHIESHRGLFSYADIEWIRLSVPLAPSFSVQVEHDYADGSLTVWGYRRVGLAGPSAP